MKNILNIFSQKQLQWGAKNEVDWFPSICEALANATPEINNTYIVEDDDVFINKDELIKLRNDNTNTKSITTNGSCSPNIIYESDYFLDDIEKNDIDKDDTMERCYLNIRTISENEYRTSDLFITKNLVPKINDNLADDTNIKKTLSGRCLYSNGYLKMVNGITTYIVPTIYYYGDNQINIYYELNFHGNKKIGFYKNNIFYNSENLIINS